MLKTDPAKCTEKFSLKQISLSGIQLADCLNDQPKPQFASEQAKPTNGDFYTWFVMLYAPTTILDFTIGGRQNTTL